METVQAVVAWARQPLFGLVFWKDVNKSPTEEAGACVRGAVLQCDAVILYVFIR